MVPAASSDHDRVLCDTASVLALFAALALPSADSWQARQGVDLFGECRVRGWASMARSSPALCVYMKCLGFTASTLLAPTTSSTFPFGSRPFFPTEVQVTCRMFDLVGRNGVAALHSREWFIFIPGPRCTLWGSSLRFNVGLK